ncbi:MAG: tRNA (cytidine(34)-2'-O)-methyltransferase [Lachnospiraceae bacterium]|nr:tRNA (cytidine(34)-2'-O)-methyltransferase [Lachnospiraceae bacterium]
MNVVLLAPEIPDNTGNIGRTCMATGSRLHLIDPLGFSLSDRALKRAGMDYWKEVAYERYVDFEDFLSKRFQDVSENGKPVLWMLTTKAERSYAEVSYGKSDYLMFGSEGRGIPEELLVENREHCIRIPMAEGARSLNLANSVAIVLYEALRQNGFPDLERKGSLHHSNWH